MQRELELPVIKHADCFIEISALGVVAKTVTKRKHGQKN
jgi:hypothetical protein